MSHHTHDAIACHVREAIDIALVAVLTAEGAASGHAHAHVQRAVELLADHGGQTAVADDAAEAIHAAHEHLHSGRWDDARCALVTARGRLARPGSRYTGTPTAKDCPE
ncbi:hypothetical protein [Saccharopolyspora pogona]|uniref:hypothetical protein n=1 Tax=Saccharopolyspora pogona TaxID=333966 RepID=UPI001686EF23|nr:hypothetical protein [Saccharopolyspora pogona]